MIVLLRPGFVEIALYRPDDGIRPIGVPEVWFRLVARCLVHKAKNRVKTYLGSIQLGVGVPTATESIIHKISSIISVWDDDAPTRLLQLDVRNAFNSISRQSIWEQVHVVIPDLERWFLWAYGQPAPMFPDEAVDHVIWATAGVIQGDPLGPLFFALGQQKVLLQIQGLLPEFSIWYLDDGVLVASEAWLQSHWAQICEAYRMIGLEVNPKKCLLFGGTATCNTLNLPQHPLTAGIVLLGTPLGSASHIDATLNNHYLRLEGLLRLLPNLRCKQVEFGILRYCLGPSKILHLHPHPSSCSDVCVVRSSGSTTFLHVGNTGRGAYTSCCMGSSHSSSAKRWLRAGTCRRHSSPSLHGFLSASCVLQSPGRSN